jgi:DNA mismatch endonuclease (patch repair protein)
MQAVKSKDTAPELLVRRLLYAHGYRYRLHSDDLPGRPDIVFAGRKKVIFINGCFWHGHDCARGSRVPKTNREYWTAKVARNRTRDVACQKDLESAGWRVLRVWECEISDEQLLRRLRRFLGVPGK